MAALKRMAWTLFIGCLISGPLAFAQEGKVELLWPEGAPGAVGTEEADKPTLTIWPAPADKATGTAIVLCPGGGYGGLAIDHEGKQIGEFFNQQGVSIFMLKYRLAPRYKHPAPMQDVQHAIRTVRARAAEWKIDPARIGVMGFSAGGHLASTAATHFDAGLPEGKSNIEKTSCRPDFAILGYPVITMDPAITHGGSRRNLLGENPPDELVKLMSNELQVTAQTPPTFIFHTTEDAAVIPENAILFYSALRKAKVPAELHIYERGPHGVGLAQKDPILSSWPARLLDWMKLRSLLTRPKIVADDPAKVTDPDFVAQGEYVGEIPSNDGLQKFGVQVIALGDGKFRAVGYQGGLPGAGWDGSEKKIAEGERKEGVPTFMTEHARVTIKAGAMDVFSLNDGNQIASFKKTVRESPTMGMEPPAGAVVLFNGKSGDAFEGARLTPDGLLMEGVTSKQKFGNCKVHLEFRLPYQPNDRDQARGNSGCYLQGRYEVQILDSFGLAGKNNECGGLYSIKDPDLNMCLPPLVWQTYDIDYKAAKFAADGKKSEPARITVRHNGVVVHHEVELPKATTAAPNGEGADKGPLFLQNHGNPVRFRNIWVVEEK